MKYQMLYYSKWNIWLKPFFTLSSLSRKKIMMGRMSFRQRGTASTDTCIFITQSFHRIILSNAQYKKLVSHLQTRILLQLENSDNSTAGNKRSIFKWTSSHAFWTSSRRAIHFFIGNFSYNRAISYIIVGIIILFIHKWHNYDLLHVFWTNAQFHEMGKIMAAFEYLKKNNLISLK